MAWLETYGDLGNAERKGCSYPFLNVRAFLNGSEHDAVAYCIRFLLRQTLFWAFILGVPQPKLSFFEFFGGDGFIIYRRDV